MSEEKKRGSRLSPEIQVLSRVERLLDGLDERARRRVVEWMRDRYDGILSPSLEKVSEPCSNSSS